MAMVDERSLDSAGRYAGVTGDYWAAAAMAGAQAALVKGQHDECMAALGW